MKILPSPNPLRSTLSTAQQRGTVGCGSLWPPTRHGIWTGCPRHRTYTPNFAAPPTTLKGPWACIKEAWLLSRHFQHYSDKRRNSRDRVAARGFFTQVQHFELRPTQLCSHLSGSVNFLLVISKEPPVKPRLWLTRSTRFSHRLFEHRSPNRWCAWWVLLASAASVRRPTSGSLAGRPHRGLATSLHTPETVLRFSIRGLPLPPSRS